MRNTFIFFLFIHLFLSHKAGAQNNALYTDSIDRYQKEVDSLILDFTNNLSSRLQRTSIHYRCAGENGGAFAEIYKDATGKIIYRLTRQSNCDSLYEDKAYYFINNKLVLVIDALLSAAADKERKYYRNDILVSIKDITIQNPKAYNKDLQNAYELLNDFKETR